MTEYDEHPEGLDPDDLDPEVDVEIDDLEEVEITETGSLRFADDDD